MRIIFGKVITLINMSNEHHTASRWCVPFVTQWVFIILTRSKWYCYHFYHSSSALSPRPRQPRVITNQIRTWAAKGYGGMQHFLPTSSNRSHLAHSYVTFKFSGKLEACDKSTLWSWEMFDSFRWARCRGFSGGRVSALNAEREASARSHWDPSLCRFAVSNQARLVSEWVGSSEGRKK